MNSSDFSKGDILEATDRSKGKGEHYIIKLRGRSNYDFIGAMITTSSLYGNVPMSINHFETLGNNGQLYKVFYKNSHLVQGKFIKPEIWGNFSKVGQLTSEGIDFVEDVVGNMQEETFESYLRRTQVNIKGK